MGISRYY